MRFFKLSMMPLLVVCFNSLASDWAEAETLARLIEHIEASKALLNTAKESSNAKKRLQFDYEMLEKNLNEIKEGITIYLEHPIEPRSFEEISNSFSDYKLESEQ